MEKQWTDPVRVIDPIAVMKQRGIRLTRANYLAISMPDGVPDPVPAEVLAELPECLRDSIE